MLIARVQHISAQIPLAQLRPPRGHQGDQVETEAWHKLGFERKVFRACRTAAKLLNYGCPSYKTHTHKHTHELKTEAPVNLTTLTHGWARS